MLFQLSETIARYNRLNQKNIKSTQTWGLRYLQTDHLNFLNEARKQLHHTIINPVMRRVPLREETSLFKIHSSESLFASLEQIVHYETHFSLAQSALHHNQTRWIPWQRVPLSIANAYNRFLVTQRNDLKRWHHRILEQMLFRLMRREQEHDVLADESMRENPLHLSKVFNQLQRAIENVGTVEQKNQLYQFSWYTKLSDTITTVEMDSHRLLIPVELKQTIPKKVRKPRWLFPRAYEQRRFLETHQALLAQLTLPIQNEDHFFLSNAIGTVKQLTRRLFLLQHAICSIEPYLTPRFRWPWQKKSWQHVWQIWLENQFQKNQDDLVEVLTQHIQTLQTNIHAGNLLRFQIHFQSLLKTINPWLKQSPSPEPLTALMQQFSTFLEKEIKAANEAEQVTSNKRDRALVAYGNSVAPISLNFLQKIFITLCNDMKVHPVSKKVHALETNSIQENVSRKITPLKPFLRTLVHTQNAVFSSFRSKQKENNVSEVIKKSSVTCL